jgi:ribonuclease P protein component
VHSRAVVLFYLPQAGIRKYGFTASKKVGNAVARNLAKRRLRALFAEFCPMLNEGTYILVAKTAIGQTTYDVLKSDLKKILKRAGGIIDDKKSSS